MPSIEATSSASIDAVENAMKGFVLNERINLKDLFKDSDKMRSGTVHRGVFISRIKTAFPKVHMTADILNGFADKYAAGPSGRTVDYETFIETIDLKATSLRGIHTSPSKAIQTVKVSGFMDGKANVDASVINRIRKTVSTRRPNLRLIFKNYDRFNKGFVTKHQFMRVVREELAASCKLTGEELQMLADAFGTGNGYDSNYIKFIDMVDDHKFTEFALGSQNAVRESSSFGASRSSTSAHTHESVLEKLKRISKCRGVRFKDFLEDADKHKRNQITRAAFSRGMSRAGVVLSPAECDALLPAYVGRDGTVLYRDFCRDIESAEIVHGLEQRPMASGDVPDLRDSVFQAIEMSSEEAAQCERAMDKIQKIVNGNILLTPAFKNFDKINRASCLPQYSVARLTRCALKVSQRATLKLL